MTLLAPRHDAPLEIDAEALIKEARRLRRLRWIKVGGALLIMAAGAALGVILTRSAEPKKIGTTSSPPKNIASLGAVVAPKSPQAMAVAPNGALYVIDGGRDQILRRMPNNTFRIVAGTGKRGFSGDGGPAINAEIHVGYQAGIAIAENGTVYFADDWNGRVRAILPDGIIKTVAGGGHTKLGTKSVPALSASFGKSYSLFDLTIGPDSDLYIGASAVYRLTKSGALQWVVGESLVPAHLPPGWKGVYSNPAMQLDFSPAARIAFDNKGDLLVAGGGGWGLYERSAAGKLSFLENFRGDGYWGALATAPNGSVILSQRHGLTRFDPSGSIVSINTSSLNAPLGRMNGGPHDNTFIGGDGLAVSRTGVIYVDTDVGNSFTSVSAILAINPAGHVSTVWRS